MVRTYTDGVWSQTSESSVSPSCWTFLLCLPLPLSSPSWGLFVLIYNFPFSAICENSAGGKWGRNRWRGMPKNRPVVKERTEMTGRQKTQETERILNLDYTVKRPCIRLQMRCDWEQMRGQRELSGNPCKRLWDQSKWKKGMRNKSWEADYNELNKWAEDRVIGINLRSPLRGRC